MSRLWQAAHLRNTILYTYKLGEICTIPQFNVLNLKNSVPAPREEEHRSAKNSSKLKSFAFQYYTLVESLTLAVRNPGEILLANPL